MRGLLVALVGAGLLLSSPAARADAIDARCKQLRGAAEYKVRVSAAMWLSRQRDARAIEAMAHALVHDRHSTVRGIAAVSLGKMIHERLPAKPRDGAIDALRRAARRDRDAGVRAKARASHARVKALRTPRGGRLPAVFVAVATPGKASRGDRAALEASLRQALRRHAPGYGQGTEHDGLPTRSALEASNTRGFMVTVQVADISVSRARRRAEVRCEVALRVNPWTGRDGDESLRAGESASATGRAMAIGLATKAGIATARRDCVDAAVDAVTGKQIVPFVKRAVDRRVAQRRGGTR